MAHDPRVYRAATFLTVVLLLLVAVLALTGLHVAPLP